MKKLVFCLSLCLAACGGGENGSNASQDNTPITEDNNKPVKEIPIEQEPVKEIPVPEEPVKEIPVEEVPVKEEPSEEIPGKEEPIKDTPVKEDPALEEPVKEEPVKNDHEIENKNLFAISKTENQFFFYLPTKQPNTLLRYRIEHYLKDVDINAAFNNADLWRMADVTEYDKLTKRVKRGIVKNAEWDTAIVVQGASDHVGGIHGDEIITDVKVLVNGKEIKTDEVFNSDISEFKLVQTSNIFFLNSKRVLAQRIKIMVVNKDGMVNHQKIIFKEEAEIARAWVTMFPIYRNFGDYQITDTFRRLPLNIVEDISTIGFEPKITTVALGDGFEIYGKNSGVYSLVKVNMMKGLPSPTAYVTNSTSYNKLYISAINHMHGNYWVKPGEEWEISVNYQININ